MIMTFSDTGYNLMENIISLKINITRESQISEKYKSKLTELNQHQRLDNVYYSSIEWCNF